MKSVNQEVTSRRLPDGSMSDKQQVVAVIDIQQAETLQEAVTLAGSEQGLLDRFNSQWKTDKMNDAREGAVGGPTKNAIETEAYARISADEFAACQGDPNRIRDLIQWKKDEVSAELKAKQAAARPPTTSAQPDTQAVEAEVAGNPV